MKEFNERVFKNWKTSLLGVVLLIVSIVGLFMKVLDGNNFIMLIPTILFLFRVNDTFLGNIGGKGPAAVIIMAMLISPSCATRKKCFEKYGTKDTTYVTKFVEIPYYITLPADSNSTSLNVDSIKILLPDQKYYVINSNSKTCIFKNDRA